MSPRAGCSVARSGDVIPQRIPIGLFDLQHLPLYLVYHLYELDKTILDSTGVERLGQIGKSD